MDGQELNITADYGSHESKMQTYLMEGEKQALSLGNRGPIRFTSDGALEKDIVDSYREHGFYIFENVLDKAELTDIESDLKQIQTRLPKDANSNIDASGKPALTANCKSQPLYWAKPLSDPFGGTTLGNGRHQINMTEPTPSEKAPEEIVYLIVGSLQFSDACLRVYGHPDLLAIAEQINGADFVPFNEALFIKEPGLGASVSWHQDGQTHWNKPDLDEYTHGFNFMAQLYGCNAVNGLWVIPSSHKLGKVDIKSLCVDGDADRIPGAVPLLCQPGDVAMTSRQIVHGSFANTSLEPRVTVNFGFHKRTSVLNVETKNFDNEPIIYDEEFIRKRSRVIGYAINARSKKFPQETPYVYQPFKNDMDSYQWSATAREGLRDYNTTDIFI
jgi:ectoine hydroxylase-related dioxygenase (phytanoyl-CoA dioxygenase family)